MTVLFEPKYPGEVIMLEMDFSPRLATGITVVSGSIAITVVTGTDAAVGSMLQSAPEADSPYLRQLCGGGVVGVLYRVVFTAVATSGEELEEEKFLPVSDSIRS